MEVLIIGLSGVLLLKVSVESSPQKHPNVRNKHIFQTQSGKQLSIL